jgi:acyl carrier protein
MPETTNSCNVDWTEFQSVVVDVLGVDADEVAPSANFFADLGGESIDLLDLSFQCQKRLGVATQLHQVQIKAAETDAEGRLTAEARREIVAEFPSLEKTLPLDGPFHWQQLFTMQAIFDILKNAGGQRSGSRVE